MSLLLWVQGAVSEGTALRNDYVVGGAALLVVSLQVWVVTTMVSLKAIVQKIEQQLFGVPGAENGTVHDVKALREAKHRHAQHIQNHSADIDDLWTVVDADRPRHGRRKTDAPVDA